MKKNNVGKGLMLVGSLRKAGITTYMKQGQLITRVSYSYQKRSNTRSQFIARQKMRHTIALWKMMKYGCKEMMFTQRPTAYRNFASLANRLPAVYVERVHMEQASFLMPGIPVSDGTLPTVQLELGEVNGTPALITNLTNDERGYCEKLWLYTARQDIDSGVIPRVRFCKREVSWCDITMVNNCIALVGEEFADDMKGWALVRVIDDRCSSQGIVTRCTLFQQYTTEEALEKAADGYGGLTGEHFLSPR